MDRISQLLEGKMFVDVNVNFNESSHCKKVQAKLILI